MLSFAPKFSLLPASILLLIIAISLVIMYTKQFYLFTGFNTLLIGLSCFIASLNIASDYILTREVIFSKFRNKSQKNDLLSTILGLNRGTDRLFKLTGLTLLLSTIFGYRLFLYYLDNNLTSPEAGVNGLIFCLMIVLGQSLYLTATKITTFRSMFLD